MQKYIIKTLELLKLSDIAIADTPMTEPIDTDSELLTGSMITLFMTAVGCLGWLVNTCRPDVAYAHSRIAQHNSKPNASAWKAVQHCFAYLKGTADWCIRSALNTDDRPLSDFFTQDTSHGWEFYCDSDFAGNAEIQNKRRSQNGYVAMLNGAPVLWGSKVSSVAFAHPLIGEAHADISSGAAEVYAAANATFEFLHLSYVADEMGIKFPLPFTLQMDNTAAQAFANNTALKTKLKHIDVRQEWVRMLRNKDIRRTSSSQYMSTPRTTSLTSSPRYCQRMTSSACATK
jgi:hypothetical protein